MFKLVKPGAWRLGGFNNLNHKVSKAQRHTKKNKLALQNPWRNTLKLLL